MYSRSNFLKLSGLLMIGALLILSGFGGTNVQAGQATMAATMSGTMGMNGTPGMMGTMGAGGAYPPCPSAMMMGTPGMMGTMMATPAMMSTMMATAAMMGTMAATPAMMGTMAATPAMMGTMAATPAMMGTMAPTTMSAYVENNGCKLTATLSGKNEVPGPGDPDGTGTANVSITRPATGTGQICFQITVSGITLPAAAAHIHMGAAGVAGPVVVPFSAPDAQGKASGCVSGVDPALIQSILTNPAGFYVNVHTSDFPNGALRGQLTAAAG